MNPPQIPTPEQEVALDAAWDELENEVPAAALQRLAALPSSLGARWVPECLARTQLGEWRLAEQALGRAGELLEAEDAGLLWARGELRLAQWRLVEARQAFEELARQEAEAGALDRLALLADLEGDSAEAERLLRELAELDAERPAPLRLSAEQFEDVVEKAAQRLPPNYRRVLEEVPVVIDPMPRYELVSGGALEETPPDLLGLYVGVPLSERSGELAELPAVIYLFQRNIERVCATRAELGEEIAVTLYHELGHALGFDEHGVAEMGLE